MSRDGGFTLLEVLVAVALASLLLTSIYGVFATASTAKEQVEKQSAAMHLGRVLITRLDRELLGLALENQHDQPALTGGKNSLSEPFIEMLTSSSGVPRPGLRLVRYRLAPDNDGELVLWRSEKGVNSRSDATEERLAQGIARLSFSFFDGRNWREDWNSLQTGRPLLVRAEISLQDLGDMPPLQSVFELPQSRINR